jgi:chromosome partitioning protein
MSRVIAVVNEKGGVGKTTTVLELAFQAGAMGKGVLVIDMDSQANATKMLLGRMGSREEVDEKGIFDLLIDEKNHLALHEVAKPATASWPNVLVVPSDNRVAGVDPFLQKRVAKDTILRKRLRPYREVFELILIDLGPRIDILTFNAMAAADYYLIPTDSSRFGLDAVRKIKEQAEIVKEVNPNLELLGVFLAGLHKGGAIPVKAIIRDLMEEHGEKFWGELKVPHAVLVTASQEASKPAGLIDPKSPVSIQYRNLARKILEEGESIHE